MSFFTFVLEAVLVSLSGVLAPGPITSVSVGYGSENPRAGAWVAVGHGVVEFPVMIGVFFGVGAVMDLPWVRTVIALVGGAFLAYMGVDMLRNIRQEEIRGSVSARSPVAAGVLLSLGNPYFLIWWATVGAGLILRSTEFGLLGWQLLVWATGYVIWGGVHFCRPFHLRVASSLEKNSSRWCLLFRDPSFCFIVESCY